MTHSSGEAASARRASASKRQHIDAVIAGPQCVARRAADQVCRRGSRGTSGLDHRAELGDHDLQGAGPPSRGLARPQLIRQSLGRYRAAVARDQHGQNVALAALAQSQVLTVNRDDQRPEKAIASGRDCWVRLDGPNVHDSTKPRRRSTSPWDKG